MKKLLGILLVTTLILGGCSKFVAEKKTESNTDTTSTSTTAKPVATIEMKSGEKMVVELEPSVAPNTVNNFISLAQKGFYDGLIFHRVIKDFMIQGGDPSGNGTGGPDYGIKGEFAINGFENPLLHEPGVISMARAQDPDSAGSQFFIMHGKVESLDGQYAAFGKVIEGMETVNKIAEVETDPSDMPLEPVVISKITIELNGYDFKEPEVIKAQ